MIITEEKTGIEEIAVRASDTDRFYDATLAFFFSSSQEAAGEHATLLGLGIKEMAKRDKRTWIIVRTRMDFKRIPKWREKLTFETFPQRGYKLFCPRVVTASDEEGNFVMNAMTHWVLMDIERKRPLPAKLVEADFHVDKLEHRFQNPDLGKIKKYEDSEKIEIYEEKSFLANYFDIDLNGHVNNVAYIRWACEAIPDEVLIGFKIDAIDVQWESQTFEGEEVKVETAALSKDGGKIELVHRISKADDGKIVFEANSLWSEKNQ